MISSLLRRRALMSAGGTAVGTLSVGTEILLSESGADVPFIVIQQGYEGSNVTLVLRKELCADTMVWTETGTLNHPDYRAWKGIVDDFLVNTYMARLSSKVQSALVNVAMPTSYYSNTSQIAITTQRSCFALSQKEMGYSTANYNIGEGSAIPYFDTAEKKKGYIGTTAYVHWTRSFSYCDYSAYYYVYIVAINTSAIVYEALKTSSNTMNSYRVRPAITLNPNFKVKLAN